MIRKLVLRRFKRFDGVAFSFAGHVVLAGPNNTGKTTVLQAVAAWDFSLRRWRQANDFSQHDGAYTKVPVTRQAFTAVPLRAFDLLWRERSYDNPVEIEVQSQAGWTLPMELIPDTTEQIYVRPRRDVATEVARNASAPAVFIPPMSGLVTEEPLYANREFLDYRLSQARPGEVLRNVLVEASQSPETWDLMVASIRRLFGYELLRPDPAGAHILSEYQASADGPRLDIASAGSGFQQVLMLLSHLYTRPGSVLLLDEPDAHLHVILQDAIYSELRGVAARQRSQLVIATHSEVVINSVDPDEVCVVLSRPRALADNAEKKRLIKSLGILTNTDVMLAQDAPGVLYVEDYTDLEVLRAWARALSHPALGLLTTRLLWHRSAGESPGGGGTVSSNDHFAAMRLVRADLPGVEILDRDGNPNLPAAAVTGGGLLRLYWSRYEIESYLVHPAALDRFLEAQLGANAYSREGRAALRQRFESLFTGLFPEFERTPLTPPPLIETFLRSTKARAEIVEPLLSAAGLPAFPYTRYHEIAAGMRPDEIHREVTEKLDAIVKTFRH